jgi:hypothetical protein
MYDWTAPMFLVYYMFGNKLGYLKAQAKNSIQYIPLVIYHNLLKISVRKCNEGRWSYLFVPILGER